MSAQSYIQSRAVPFALSLDGVTFKNVVCKKTWGITLDKTVTQDENDCGVATSVGNATKFSSNFEFVLNKTPNTGEWGSDDVANFANNGTLVYFKFTDGTSGYLRTGHGYISNYVESAPFGGVVNATGTLTGDGNLSIGA